LSEDDKLLVARARKIEKFFSQLCWWPKSSRPEGKYVPLSETIRGFAKSWTASTTTCLRPFYLIARLTWLSSRVDSENGVD